MANAVPNSQLRQMKKLVQVIYISRSTFDPNSAATKFEPNVAQILSIVALIFFFDSTIKVITLDLGA